MNLVYDLLDRLVEQDPLQRVPNAGALVLELEKLMGKTKAKAHVLDRGVRQHCLYCAEGAYQVVFDHLAPKLAEEEMQRRRVLLGLGVASGGSLVLVCDNCGHVQLFRPEAAARGNAWR